MKNIIFNGVPEIATAYYAQSLKMMSEIAHILGKTEDGNKYRTIAKNARNTEVDLVVVGAPDRFHVPYAKQILNAGKHALIEKPFAPTAEEALEVFTLAKEVREGRRSA